jgi:hypothetical protein
MSCVQKQKVKRPLCDVDHAHAALAALSQDSRDRTQDLKTRSFVGLSTDRQLGVLSVLARMQEGPFPWGEAGLSRQESPPTHSRRWTSSRVHQSNRRRIIKPAKVIPLCLHRLGIHEAEHIAGKCAENVGGLSVWVLPIQVGRLTIRARSVMVHTWLAICRAGQTLVSPVIGIRCIGSSMHTPDEGPHVSRGKNRGFSRKLCPGARVFSTRMCSG